MKSNLAVLSSDNKTIQFIKNNNLEDLCNLYANSSRNTDDAKLFCKNHGFEKYYGSYEDLIEDNNIEYIVNININNNKFIIILI
mgnify:CR=1 FL=1